MPVDKSQSQNATAVWLVGADGNPLYPSTDGTTANPSVTSELSAANVATGQLTVSSTTLQLVPARAGRKSIVITTTNPASPYYVGASNLTTANGFYLGNGASVSLSTAGAVYVVCPAGGTLTYIETY